MEKEMFIDGNIIRRREIYGGMMFKETNKVWLSGILEKEFSFDHTGTRGNFYQNRVIIERKSGVNDYIPIVIFEESLEDKKVQGNYVEIAGELRSKDFRGEDGKHHLRKYVYAYDINICEDEKNLKDVLNANLVYVEGNVCKTPTFRYTPKGKTISDIVIGVDAGTWNKSAFVHSIAWGNKAIWAANNLEAGDRIAVFGRMQSREYYKKLSEKKGEMRETTEVSILKMLKL